MSAVTAPILCFVLGGFKNRTTIKKNYFCSDNHTIKSAISSKDMSDVNVG